MESNAETISGVSSSGDIEYATEHIQEGHFGQVPESLHGKAYQLFRLIAANHPFVDGNKRTALISTRIFYALNGLRFDYDRTIKEVLKSLATDEAGVDDWWPIVMSVRTHRQAERTLIWGAIFDHNSWDRGEHNKSVLAFAGRANPSPPSETQT